MISKITVKCIWTISNSKIPFLTLFCCMSFRLLPCFMFQYEISSLVEISLQALSNFTESEIILINWNCYITWLLWEKWLKRITKQIPNKNQIIFIFLDHIFLFSSMKSRHSSLHFQWQNMTALIWWIRPKYLMVIALLNHRIN